VGAAEGGGFLRAHWDAIAATDFFTIEDCVTRPVPDKDEAPIYSRSASITQPDVIEKILKHLGLPTKPPKFDARGPPHDPDDQLHLIWHDDDQVA
jgi:hypothetical protein